MTITIDLPPDVEASAKTQADKEGLPLEDYVMSLVQEGTQRRDRIELLAEKPFDEILAPFRRSVKDSGVSDEDLDNLFTTARKEASRARRERARGCKDSPRVVFDCNVLLQAAARERSVAAKCLNLVESGHVQLFVSREVLAEVEDVLNRPEIRAHFPDLSDEIVGAFLKRLQNLSALVRLVPKQFSYPRDEDDEPYINLAVAADADFIISRDRDLLDLMTGHIDECKEFRQRFRSLSVVGPAEFLKLLEENQSE